MTNFSHYTNALKKFYLHEGIGVDEFNCKYQHNCHGDSPVFKGSDTHVGCNYGNPYKIVIISADRGQGSKNLENRRQEIEALSDNDLNRHMKGTKETLLAFLGDSYHDLFSRFALINAAKCCVNNGRMEKAPKQFFRNCNMFVLKELQILKPDIIITQGQEAKKTMGRHLRKISQRTVGNIIELAYPTVPSLFKDSFLYNVISDYFYSVKLEDNKTVLVICTVHPSERYGMWNIFRKMMLPTIVDVYQQIISNSLLKW